MNKIYFGSNLKMYKTAAETVQYLEALTIQTQDLDRSRFEIFIIPSYTALDRVTASPHIRDIRIGAQNMGWETEGPFTGEISSRMLQEFGIGFVMVGHSERRHVFGEDDAAENRKVLHGMKEGFTVLLCIGETAEEKEAGRSDEVLRRQLVNGLAGVLPEQTDRIWIAYEPVWSIGEAGTPAPPEYAQARHRQIKECLQDLYADRAEEIPVLYGGSVNPGNAASLLAQPSIDGLFVGRSAWDAAAFRKLIDIALAGIQDSASY